MKIILSHDVDHLYWKEHYLKDLYLPGTILRNFKGLLKGQLNWSLYKLRLKCWGRLHNIPELIKFYDKENLNANFFFGMDNALHLSYNYKNAIPIIKELIESDHRVGVHGIGYNNSIQIQKEFKRFKTFNKIDKFGIRTHYLRLSDNSLKMFENQGYIFDSSIEAIKLPVKYNNLWEIPISIMDASLVKNSQLNQNMESWKNNTYLKLEKAKKHKIPFFVINFHDTYFSENFPVIKSWFIWLVSFLKTEKYDFITFEEAVNELNNKLNFIE